MLYSARVVLLLAAALAVRGGTRGDMRDARQLQWEDAPRGAAGQAFRSARKQLLAWEPTDATAEPGATYVPKGGKGKWENGGSTGIIMVHANVMKNGEVVGWSSRYMGLQEYGSAVYYPTNKTHEQLLDECGIHDCKNAFCGAQTTTAGSEVLIFGGHADDINWFRSYNHGSGALWSTEMSSGRWYPTSCTLADGKVLVVGGVADSGKAGYHVEDMREVDNPTYEVYDPVLRQFTGDKDDMAAQLSAAFPLHTYPHVHMTPDGGVVVSAGKLLVKYNRTDDTTFTKAYDLPDRPGAPWSYPQTGLGTPLPLEPPYDRMYFLAAGGTSKDRANDGTPASDAAEIIELTEGAGATWRSLGPMPYPRVMGDALILCDGTIGLFGGANQGIAGWSKKPRLIEFRDGTSYNCEDKCPKSTDPNSPLYEPTIFNPATGMWSEKGSLAEAVRPRLYHGTSILLPDCRVMLSGSDTTYDQTAELYSPPYLNKGPRPTIQSVPDVLQAGSNATISYHSPVNPVVRAILIRTGAITHSMQFDQRALWLEVASNSGCELTVQLPANRAVLPPGMYMLTILTDQGAPAVAKVVSIP